MIIAIDGPAGSGKTTTAKLLAQRLNIFYLDTGATYRALTFAAMEEGIDPDDGSALAELARALPLIMQADKVLLADLDITKEIRAPHIDKNISKIVAHPQVRSFMVELQRELARGRDCIVEGRDITTVVFPKAEHKFYLDADSKMRAKRRFNELRDKEINVDFREVKSDLEKRDWADKTRKTGPLVMSEDAIVIDTSNLSIEETALAIEKYLNFPDS